MRHKHPFRSNCTYCSQNFGPNHRVGKKEMDEIQQQQQTTGDSTTINGHFAKWLRVTRNSSLNEYKRHFLLLMTSGKK